MKSIRKDLIGIVLAAVLTLFLLTGALAKGEGATYSDTDLTESYGASATFVNLSDADSGYVISAGGDYVLSGTLKGGITVEASDTEKVHIVLNGVSIVNPNGPALYIKTADKVVLTLADGTRNTLQDGENYTLDEEGANAAVYSKADLTINGTGSLTVNGLTAHGIVTKDDLKIISGTLTVTAVKDALRGKDSVTIKDGILTLEAGSDGIASTNTEEGKGFVLIEGGQFVITTGSGAAAAVHVDMGFGRGWQQTTQTTDETASMKGIKAQSTLEITGGTFTLDTEDDALHSNGNMIIRGGSFTISAGDDALHANGEVWVYDGLITVADSYEGIEGTKVVVEGGIISILASDDGINATSGTAAAFGNRESPQQGVAVEINGGTLRVTATNDAIDSNGAITINGGDLNLTTLNAGRGGTATLDANGQVTVNGGNVVTNDGSENGGGMGSFGGRPGRMGRP